MKCWWTMPMRCLMAWRGEPGLSGLALEDDLPFIGRENAAEYAHQNGLAGTVFTEKGVNFILLDIEGDAGAYDERPETLVNAIH